jgi:hypothetical protein
MSVCVSWNLFNLLNAGAIRRSAITQGGKGAWRSTWRAGSGACCLAGLSGSNRQFALEHDIFAVENGEGIHKQRNAAMPGPLPSISASANAVLSSCSYNRAMAPAERHGQIAGGGSGSVAGESVHDVATLGGRCRMLPLG